MRTLIIISVATVAGCAADRPLPIPHDARSVTVQPVTEAQRYYTGFEAELRTVIRDDAAWTTAWERLNAPFQPVPTRPAIDFAHDTVILAAMGTRSTGGFQIDVVEGRTTGDDDWFTIRETSPGSNCGVTEALTAPAAVVTVPRFGGNATFIDLGPATFDCE